MATQAANRFNDLVRKDPAAAREQWEGLLRAFATRGITFGGTPMPTLLRPQFVDLSTWHAMTTGAAQLVSLSERVAKNAFGGDLERLLDFLGAPEEHRRLLRIKPAGPDVALSRVDGFIDAGRVRFIEINSDAPAGFGYADRMTEVFAELKIVAELAGGMRITSVGSIDALVNELRRHARVESPRLAIVDLASVRTRPDQEILHEEFLRRGLDTVLADPREMETVNGRLVAQGHPIDVVYRRTVISEVLAIESEARAFFEAYAHGRCVFVNSFRCYLSEDKAFFALLTDERFGHLLSPEEGAFIQAHIPWTRKIEDRRTERDGETIDLVPWLADHRDEMVLKPSHGYGGDRVTIGSQVTPSEWSHAIHESLQKGQWIAQERVSIPEEEFPVFDGDGSLRFESLKVNTNPFYIGGSSAGAVTRVSRDSVINVSAGGGSIPTLVVD